MCLEHEIFSELEVRAWELLEFWDVWLDNATVERFVVYTFVACFAAQWRQGRVLLVGDAAHQMLFFVGQGMCTGIRDVANLAWKLDLVLMGMVSDALLDTFDQERLPSVRQVVEFSVELGKVICVSDFVEVVVRDEAMAVLVGVGLIDVPSRFGIINGVIDSEFLYVGKLFPQGTIDGRRFDDVHGVGWCLVTIDLVSIAVDLGMHEWFVAIGGSVVTVTVDDGYSGWFVEHDATVVLQRSDFHLYGIVIFFVGVVFFIEHLRTRLVNQFARQGVSL